MVNLEWELSEKQIAHMNDRDRIIIVEGSAGSGKTIFAVHKVIMYAMTHPNAYIGIFRSTMPSLRRTSLKEIKKYLDKYGLQYHENKSEGTITLFNNAQMVFSGLDELEKIRSMNLDYEYIEQAEEIDRDTYIELERRVRGEVGAADYSQILMVVTPEDETHWIYQMFHIKHLGKVIHFHYTENPYLPEPYLKGYEELKEVDYELYRKYTEGKWGKLTNIVYENWDTERLTRGVEYYCCGLDKGHTHPACFLLIAWFESEPYIVFEVYKKGMTSREFALETKKRLQDEMRLKPSQVGIVHADSASPDWIREFNLVGFNCIGITKKKDNATGKEFIQASIDSCKYQKIHIYEECENTLREIKSYKYATNADGVVMETPAKNEKIDDHSMDAMRYAIYGTVGSCSPFQDMPDIEECYCS